MVEIPMRTKGALDRETLLSMNTQKRTQAAYNAQNIEGLNRRTQQAGTEAAPGAGTSGRGAVQRMTAGGSVPEMSVQMQMPSLLHPLQKGQKAPVFSGGLVRPVDVCIGWNSTDARCDVDVSAFLLGENGKVPGDDWFVFYGQTKSPDRSTVFEVDGVTDREVIRLDPAGLNPAVKKIVFVLTIHEAAAKGLHFGMLKDAYIRILDHGNREELVSFSMTDYYTNVISMMIGELYLHNGNWKFHGIGNGVAKDLAGLCALYGVQVNG